MGQQLISFKHFKKNRKSKAAWMSVAMHSTVPGAVSWECYVLGERMVQTAFTAVPGAVSWECYVLGERMVRTAFTAVPGAVSWECYVLGERMVQTAFTTVLKRPGRFVATSFSNRIEGDALWSLKLQLLIVLQYNIKMHRHFSLWSFASPEQNPFSGHWFWYLSYYN